MATTLEEVKHLMNRQEFLLAVSKLTGRKPSTISQYIYAFSFKPMKTVPEGPVIRPYFSRSQIQQVVDLVMKKGK